MLEKMRTTSRFFRVADWTAGRISDPIQRLRFLQTAMHLRYRGYGWLMAPFPAVLFLLTAPVAQPIRTAAPLSIPQAVRVAEATAIWQVEKTNDFETYSNGLRIDNRYSVSNTRRSYRVFSAVRPDDFRGQLRAGPAGIVFHTSESLQISFEAGQNAALERVGESLLSYVKLRRAYNFVIDRFGRVYRIVVESDAANHAGYSVWADSEWVYLNLNQSFLAVSFETQTSPGQTDATVNPAQIRSAAMLTEMLRNRYGIPAIDCVTHAQVSVNASNLRIGSHFDWASSFPFEQLGLPDNYALPLPAVSLFGFGYDSEFARQGGARLAEEAQQGDQIIKDRATASGTPISDYRKILQRGYRARLAAARHKSNLAEREEWAR
jgi:N-acetylmuramoyl-L-alanine amidase